MNRLKRLFSPSALAATVATGMLISSVLAQPYDCYSAHATLDWSLQCPNGLRCNSNDPCGSGTQIYWCCAATNWCGDLCQVYPVKATCVPGEDPYAYAWCCPANCQ